jgi:hypothetical protein
VFPNKGGAPYERMDYSDGASGKGYFWDLVKSAGLKGVVTFLPFTIRSRSWLFVSLRPAVSNQTTKRHRSRQRVQPQPRLPAMSVPFWQRGQVSSEID